MLTNNMKEGRKRETLFLLRSLSSSWRKVDEETAGIGEQEHLMGCGFPHTKSLRRVRGTERIDAYPTDVAQA